MANPIAGLLQSKKFVLLVLVSIIGAVFVALKIVPVEEYAKFVAAGTVVLIAAIAHVDAATAKASGPPDVVAPSIDPTALAKVIATALMSPPPRVPVARPPAEVPPVAPPPAPSVPQ